MLHRTTIYMERTTPFASQIHCSQVKVIYQTYVESQSTCKQFFLVFSSRSLFIILVTSAHFEHIVDWAIDACAS